jgi:GH24 family phage-related lysozyme (muramidase)
VHLEIPLEAAKVVFLSFNLPRHGLETRRAYPGVEDLPADAQSGLLSLVFNRGTRMDTDRRREMKAIQSLVVDRDLAGIAAQIRAMKRLWDPQKLGGLIKRREREAQLVEGADRVYDPTELVRL